MMHAVGVNSPLNTFQYFLDHQAEVLNWTWEHIWLSVVPVVIGLIISLPIGWMTSRYKWTYPSVVSVSGVLYTIPSIALFVIVPKILGISILSPINVVVALTLYTVALMVRVVSDALSSVPEDVSLAATAMGYSPLRRVVTVDLPMSIPVIAAGLRVATASNVSLVAVAATVGIPELGQLFTVGLQLSVGSTYYPPIVLGIVLCLLLAVVLDAIIVIATRLMTPWQRAVKTNV